MQVSTIAALGVLAKVGAAGLFLLSRRRGKRAAEEQLSLEQLAQLEVEDCYKRVICSAATGQ